ncbi:MAG: SCO family protein [Anaerolineales bacterium]|nr:SCO family protein [Anaerolineales bacterium]
MKASHFILLLIAFLTGFAAVAGTLFLSKPYVFNGVTLDPPVEIEDFALIDQHGQRFSLRDQTDKIVLIFFGYTHCPDICPVTLSDFRDIKSKLGDLDDQVEFVFITVDPERDTPEQIYTYLQIFENGILGLSGERYELEKVWESFFVYQEKVDAGSEAGYLVDHTSRVYLVDKQGELRLTFHFGTTSNEMAEDIIYLLGRE